MYYFFKIRLISGGVWYLPPAPSWHCEEGSDPQRCLHGGARGGAGSRLGIKRHDLNIRGKESVSNTKIYFRQRQASSP